MSNRDLYNLQVYCNNEAAGCKWRGRLNDLDSHLKSNNGCLYEMTSCPRSCGTKLLRSDVGSHCKNKCPLLVINCPHCLVRGEKRFIKDQHLEECSKVPVTCPNNCGIDIANENLSEHRNTCPLQVVTCEFSMFGCDTMVTRQESDEHNKDDATKHLALVKARLTAATKELQSSKVQLTKVKEKLNAFQSTLACGVIEVLSMIRLLDTLDSTKQKQEISNLQKQISLCRQSLLFLPDYQIAPVMKVQKVVTCQCLFV
ncbi:TNF receptor-associated factor 3-like [Dysidea avara]|uniref:TNF receptor-associated factor 3-like n=1 Tax=Dysidea avara TaxID=196820 RepID=UPI0033333179